MILYLFILFLCSGGVLSANIPCSIEDSVCLTEAAQEAYVKLMEENQSLGVESSEPMQIDLIDGDLSILKFQLFNNTIKGFKNCKVENVKINEDKTKVHIAFTCPGFDLRGKYNISGRLIILPVEGNGDYHIVTKTYRINIDIEVKLKPGDDGKTYASIKSFKLDVEPVDGIVFSFKNLFNGQKELSDTVHKFANENWKEVAAFVQLPVFNTNFKKIVKSCNSYLKVIPVQSFLK